jgi:hypothetical protein
MGNFGNRTRIGCWRVPAVLLAFLQVHSLVALQNVPSQPLSAGASKIRDQVNDLAIGGKLTVFKIDGTEYHGNLQAIEATTFSIREVDLKTIVTIPYDEVDRVRKNYGGKGFGGHRVDPKKSLIAGIVIVAVLLTVVFVAVAKDKS